MHISGSFQAINIQCNSLTTLFSEPCFFWIYIPKQIRTFRCSLIGPMEILCTILLSVTTYTWIYFHLQLIFKMQNSIKTIFASVFVCFVVRVHWWHKNNKDNKDENKPKTNSQIIGENIIIYHNFSFFHFQENIWSFFFDDDQIIYSQNVFLINCFKQKLLISNIYNFCLTGYGLKDFAHSRTKKIF